MLNISIEKVITPKDILQLSEAKGNIRIMVEGTPEEINKFHDQFKGMIRNSSGYKEVKNEKHN